MRGRTLSSRFLISGRILLLCLAAMTVITGCKKQLDGLTVPLDETRVSDVPQPLRWDFYAGQAAPCSEKPDPNITAYPAFLSNKPLFGRIHLPSGLHQGHQGRWYHFALDQTRTTEQSYDKLYFDLNCDSDLTNDKHLTVHQDPPKGAVLSEARLKQQTYFECLYLPLPFGEDGNRPLEIMPRFIAMEDGDKFLTLVTTKVFKGKVNIDGRSHDVWLGHNRYISGWFNQPSTALHLVPDGDFQHRQEFRINRLMEWHRIGGTNYRFSASSSGDKLIIQTYRGKYGTLEVRTHGHHGKRAKISGALYSDANLYWFGGKLDKHGNRKPVSSARIPVGDYTAGLEVYLDDIHISISGNIHADGQRAARIDGPRVCGVKIRENEPFVLDFSTKPEILFTSPPKAACFKRGEELKVEAVLIDPKFDLMVTDLERGPLGFGEIDPDRFFFLLRTVLAGVLIAGGLWLLSLIIKSKRRILLVSAVFIAGIAIATSAVYCAANLERDYRDIAPRVNIARSNSPIVASGTMPFG